MFISDVTSLAGLLPRETSQNIWFKTFKWLMITIQLLVASWCIKFAQLLKLFLGGREFVAVSCLFFLYRLLYIFFFW